MHVDYDIYAEGEALLGWLNCTVRLESESPLDGNGVLLDVASELQAALLAERMEIAHLKLTLSPDEGNDIAVANLVRNDGRPEFSHRLQEPVESGQLILNLRAEADPQWLKTKVLQVFQAMEARQGREISS